MQKIGRQYDVVVVGSSPLSLLEAIYLRKKGKDVLVLEQNKNIGGAWATVDLPKLPNTQESCHIMLNDPLAYKFMKDKLGWDMQVLQPQPRIILGNRSLHYNSLLRYFISFFRALQLRSGKGEVASQGKVPFSYMLEKLWLTVYGLCNRRLRYPKSGSPEMTQKLMAMIEQEGIPLMTSTPVTSIEINNGEVNVATKEQKFVCREVVLTSGIGLEELRINKQAIPLTLKKRHSIHIYLTVKDPTKKRFSYVHFPGNPTLNRIEDITDFSEEFKKNYPHDHKLILVQFQSKCTDMQKDKASVVSVVELLKEKQFIDTEAEMVDYCWHTYKGSLIDRNELEKIGETNEQHIKVLTCHGITDAFRKYAKRWGRVI